MGRTKGRDVVTHGDLEIDPVALECFYHGERVALQTKPLLLLLALLERPGEVRTRAELEAALWPDGVFVDGESGLNTAVRKLRDALGDHASDPRLIETVPRVGYRFIGRDTRQAQDAEKARVRPAFGFVALGLLLVAVAALLFVVPRVAVPKRAAISEAFPTHGDARRAYVDALYLKNQHRPASIEQSVAAFELVVDLEPDHAPAWAHLAEAHAMRWFLDPSSAPDAIDDAKRASARARELAPGLPTALRAHGMIALHFDWDFEEAGRALERAVELERRSAESQLALATWLSVMHRHDEAIHRVRRAIELDPESFAVKSDAGFFLLRANRPREAAEECERALALAPEFTPATGCLVDAYTRLGDWEAVRRYSRALLADSDATEFTLRAFDAAKDPRRFLSTWSVDRIEGSSSRHALRLASHHAVLGERSKAFEWLEAAYEARDPMLVYIGSDGDLSELRDDSRFQELLRRIGLPAESVRTAAQSP